MQIASSLIILSSEYVRLHTQKFISLFIIFAVIQLTKIDWAKTIFFIDFLRWR